MKTSLPSPLRSAFVIAGSTFFEAIRNRILMVTLVFAAILMVLSVTAASVSLGERTRLIVDVGLASGSAVGSIIAIVLSVSSFGGEIRKRTAYMVLVRPIPRWGFILGKFLGLSATMALVIFTMLLATAGLVLIQGESVPIAFWGCLWLNLVEVVIVVAVSLFFSTLAIPALAATYTGGLILAGNLADDILDFVRQAATKGMENTAVLEYSYYLLPDLQKLSLRGQAANNLEIPSSFVANSTFYGLSYALTVLIGAMWVFTARKSL